MTPINTLAGRNAESLNVIGAGVIVATMLYKVLSSLSLNLLIPD